MIAIIKLLNKSSISRSYCFFAVRTIKIYCLSNFQVPYFAMYNAHFFCPNFLGKNKDAYYTWVVLTPYIYINVFNSFIHAPALKV